MAHAEHAAPRLASMVDALQQQARVRPDRTALVFLPDGETEVGRLTHADLDRRARAFAAQLQQQGLQGRAVLLMLPSSLYYAVAFVGCLYAGAIPVPAYPPTSSMHAERMAHIVADCQAHGAIVATSSALPGIGERLRHCLPGGLDCRLIPIDGMDDAQAGEPTAWQAPALHRDSTAYLQYTSGSTSQPRGVVVTHGNLLSYAESFVQAGGIDDGDVFVTWLPLFHDMGLILGLLQGLVCGATVVMMPPLAFLQKPLRWLQAISRYRGTVSYAPNFAYELCASALDQAQVNALDLSSWAVAGNAAEPVHADTLARFARRFERCGFRPAAMNPSYGLAEATLAVSSHPRLQAPRVIEVDAEQLAAGRAVAPGAGGRRQLLVSCGRPWLDTALAVVDPITSEVRVDGEVGEIWVAGLLVAGGYWQRGAESQHSFGARSADGRGPWLRTGDLGLLQDGELYVTGRLKDLIIVRGQNHYPQDIEHTVQHAHPALAIGHGAAFAVELDGEERLVVVQEVRRSQRQRLQGLEVVQAIRAAVSAAHGLQVHAVQLLRPASVHITSSGKIQRQACKASFLRGEFGALHTWREPAGTGGSGVALRGGDAAGQANAAPATAAHVAIQQWLMQRLAGLPQLAGRPPAPDRPFTELGLDSLALVQLSGDLAQWLGRPVEPTLLYNHCTIDALSRQLAGLAVAAPAEGVAAADATPDAIAIVGMACRLPGAPSVAAYWDLLERGGHAVTRVPASRWPAAAARAIRGADGADDAGDALDLSATAWGGFIDGVDEFDAAFFGISPREAASMDPQQRIVLQSAWHALEDAGIPPDALAGSGTGVFIGVCASDYRDLMRSQGLATGVHVGTGNAASIVANRLSYLLDLRGPSWAVDTACSSSLVALHQARQSLLAGECALAVAGGVNLILAPDNSIVFAQAQMLAPDGRCKTFDAGADGYVRGEGCGIVVLKRQADALRDKDRILGLIAGSAVNQDGRSNGLTAPNGLAQQAVMRQALKAAGMDASDVGYVEAHGTGTRLGDPIEMAAITAVYGAVGGAAGGGVQDPDGDRGPLWVGSAKTNIGHLEAAAGVAGLIKVVLALQHGRIPAHLHLRQLNPGISLAGTRCAIPTTAQDWRAGPRTRAAAISSFGFGGTNAHLIVREAPVPGPGAQDGASVPAVEPSDAWRMLLLSARRPQALQPLAQAHARLLQEQDEAFFAAACRAAAVHRAHHPHRLVVLARSCTQAAELLQRYEPGPAQADFIEGIANGPSGSVALLFTGQGSQHAGMGMRLFATHAGFRHTLQRCDDWLRAEQGWSLLDLLREEDGPEARLSQTEFAQPALFAVQYALAQLWLAAGVRPQALMGHSLGELVAACVAGVFSLEDGLRLVCHRGRLMQHCTAPGAMVAVQAPPALLADVLDALAQGRHADLALAARNGPEDVVLSGAPAAVEAMAAQLAQRGAHVTPLAVDRAFHSPLMRGMLQDFERCAQQLSYRLPRIPVVSNLTGHIAGAEIATPGHWVRHVMAPVQFAAGMQTLAAAGCRVFIEAGPHPLLCGLGRALVADADWLPSLRRGEDDDHQWQHSLARFHAGGGAVDWKGVVQHCWGSNVAQAPASLPSYPFAADRHWFSDARTDDAPLRVPPAPPHAPGLPRLPAVPEPAPDTAPDAAPDAALWARLPAADARQRILAYLLRQSARVLGMNARHCAAVEPSFGQMALGRLGFDSLSALRVRTRIQADFGCDVGAGHFITGTTAAQVADMLQDHLQSRRPLQGTVPAIAVALPGTGPEAASRRFDPFGLTGLQQAYWLGRSHALALGGVPAHTYWELELGGLQPERLGTALQRVIARHEMLRAVVNADGTQQVLREVPAYRIAIDDQSAAAEADAQAALVRTRERLSHQMFKLDEWPLFDIRATVLPGGRMRLHVSIDSLIADAASVFLLFRDWARLYAQPDVAWPAPALSYRDWVQARLDQAGTPGYAQSHAYWMDRLGTLPPAPALPVRAQGLDVVAPRFRRREHRVAAPAWQRLKAEAQARHITPSMLLLAVHADTLARWSTSPRFTLNLPLSLRPVAVDEADQPVGCFTSLLLLAVDRGDARESFGDFAARLQAQFLADFEHRQVDGTAVLRAWNKRQGAPLQAAMPVVFGSSLAAGFGAGFDDIERLGTLVHGVAQTPQVWLDQHVLERQGALSLFWDGVDEVFEPGVLDAMFEACAAAIERLAGQPSLWSAPQLVQLPAAMQHRRDEAARTAAALPQRRLHAAAVAQALRCPEAMAVLSPERCMSHGELLAESAAVADDLIEAGLRAGEPVAVLMHKGWQQVVAVLGVLLAGGAYLPIEADLPERRQRELLRIARVRHVLTQPGVAVPQVQAGASAAEQGSEQESGPGSGHGSGHGSAWRCQVITAHRRGTWGPWHAASLEGDLDQLAYVIFTSGTTGVPKGVMIDHRGAANTVEHVNRLLQVQPADRVLGVSSLGFDLSVYDIFGVLGAGGALVLPDHRRKLDPAHWLALLREHRVTLWNSAPQLMQMLMDAADHALPQEGSLRAVMLSGDFIPLDLPQRIRRQQPAPRIISLGGATEASIWSIAHEVGEVDPAWASIPYGKPLPNQTVQVLDHVHRVCPDHVPGRIWIGGAGLARGYWQDPDKTDRQFVRHPETGERLYDTGDLGLYAASGDIVILGRADDQVKIRGHRIELGEIESTLLRHPAVQQAAAVAIGPSRERRQLAAYVVPQPGHGALDLAALKQHLAEHLPAPAVPAFLVLLERLPLTANGKLDRQALPPITDEASGSCLVLPRDTLEQSLFEIWSGVITAQAFGVTDNFFAAGGDSIVATQLVNEVQARLDPDFGILQLFEHPSIEAMAGWLRRRLRPAEAVGPLDGGVPDATAMRRDIAAGIEQASALRFPRPDPSAPSQWRCVLVTGATGWVGAHVLAELLQQTAASVLCLVRADGAAQGHARLVQAVRATGVHLPAGWPSRITALCGDLSEARWGLADAAWQHAAEAAEAVYHLGASIDILAGYDLHRRHNVQPLAALLDLARQPRAKPVFHLSPMTVCRRLRHGRLDVLHQEQGHDDDDEGLSSAYAQSKWAAERILRAAARQGLALTVYRSAHALPSSHDGRGRCGDTYLNVLRAACAARAVPDWDESRVFGAPVDVLARLLVAHSLAACEDRVVHIDNRSALSLPAVLQALMGAQPGAAPERLAVDAWAARCGAAAAGLPPGVAALVHALFADRRPMRAVQKMFGPHPLDVCCFTRRGWADQLDGLTPPGYWRLVRERAPWSLGEGAAGG